MKLLFDCTELSFYNDSDGHRAGVFNVAMNLLKEFQKKDINITFYCDYRRYYFMKEINEFKNIPLLAENGVVNRVWGKLFFLTRKFPLKFKYALLILSRYYDNCFYRINKKNLNQIKDFDVYFSPYSPAPKEIENQEIMRFRMIHDTIPINENGVPKSPKSWHYKIYNSINKNDFYLANSECTKNDVLKYFPFIQNENIRVTYLGANESFTPVTPHPDPLPQGEREVVPSPLAGEKYIFSLCTLGKRKNIIFAIRNFFAFIEKHKIKDLKLVLGGGIWKKFEKELESTIGEFDRSKLVFTGYLKDEELPKMYSNALCFIYPSLYEGFGLPVLEAMQCGCPVITSNVSSLPEVIGNAGIQIDPKNDDEMIRAYEKMYFDNFFRELCSERGLIRSKEFSWEKCASEILDFINEKLNQLDKRY